MPDLDKAHDQRAFQFFREVTAPAFSLGYDSSFWKTLLLDLCLSKRVVRHAIIAIGCYHESFTHHGSDASPKGSVRHHVFALEQYHKAISTLRQELGSLRHEPVLLLVMCILFVCIEFMQGNETGSMEHLQQGRQMIRQFVESGSLTKCQIELIRDNIAPLYWRSGSTAIFFGFTLEPLPEELNTFAHVPPQFSTVEEARHCFHALTDRVMRSTLKARAIKYAPQAPPGAAQALETEQQTVLSLLSSWRSAFAVLQAAEPDASLLNPSVLILLIYYHATKIWISTSLTPNETAYDQHIDSFSAILPLISGFLKLADPGVDGCDHAHHERKSDASSPDNASTDQTRVSSAESLPKARKKSAFTFETHVLSTLYFVALKCRHPAVRDAALQLLGKNEHRQENLWYAKDVARVVARFIELESQNAAEARAQAAATSEQVAGNWHSQEATDAPPRADTGSILPPDPIERETSVHSTLTRPPFGLPESTRITDMVIGHREGNGRWAKFFKKPADRGGTWTVWEEHVSIW